MSVWRSLTLNILEWYLINRPAQGYPFRLKLSRPIGGKSSGSSRRRRVASTSRMTQAPRRLSDASSTGSSGSVQLFARLETSPCALSACIPIHESNPRPGRNPSSLHEGRQPGLRPSRTSFSAAKSPVISSTTKKGRCSFRTAPLETRAGNHRNQSRRRLHPEFITADP